MDVAAACDIITSPPWAVFGLGLCLGALVAVSLMLRVFVRQPPVKEAP